MTGSVPGSQGHDLRRPRGGCQACTGYVTAATGGEAEAAGPRAKRARRPLRAPPFPDLVVHAALCVYAVCRCVTGSEKCVSV
eukprot:523412-Hanusia_phi.AAC.2